MKIKVLFGNDLFSATWQDKTFKDEMSAMEWCRRNFAKIWKINDYRTLGQAVSHFELTDAFRGVVF